MVIALELTGCHSSKTDNFPMEKPYWDAMDYDNVISEIEFRTPDGEKYPALNDPETSPIFNKLIDRNNISSVVEDNTLGIRHRSEFAANMFDEYRDLAKLYSVMDREDKYVYDQEFVAILSFGLYLQIHYFKLGNDKILQEADNASTVKGIISSNQQTIISNFNNYLDFVNQENSFAEESLQNYSAGIDESFSKLMETFPEANFKSMITKATDMEKKATHPSLKNSLSNLISKLKNKMEPAPAAQ